MDKDKRLAGIGPRAAELCYADRGTCQDNICIGYCQAVVPDFKYMRQAADEAYTSYWRDHPLARNIQPDSSPKADEFKYRVHIQARWPTYFKSLAGVISFIRYMDPLWYGIDENTELGWTVLVGTKQSRTRQAFAEDQGVGEDDFRSTSS